MSEIKRSGLPLVGFSRWKEQYRRRNSGQMPGRPVVSFADRCVSARPHKNIQRMQEFLVASGTIKASDIKDISSVLTANDLLEANESVSPSTMTCSLKAGSSSVPYYFVPAEDQDLRDLIPFVLGTTFTNVSSSGQMNRTTPLAHPIYPNFYAVNMRQKGIGLNPNTLMVATDSSLVTDELPQPVPFFTLYDHYEVEIDFQSSQFPILNDIAISVVKNQIWTLPPSGANLGGAAIFTYATEWERYLTWGQVPQNDWITGLAGQSQFHTQADATVPAGVVFQGMPRLWLPNQMVKFTLHQIPYRWIYSPKSFFNRYLGFVNQFDWFPIGNANQYPAGSLLYIGYNPSSYMSPAAAVQQWANGINITTMLCDVEIYCIYTNRVQTNVPNTGSGNFVASGHNLQPYFPMRQYFYTTFTDPSLLTNYPYWFSFPIQLLFTDPDTPGINNF